MKKKSCLNIYYILQLNLLSRLCDWSAIVQSDPEIYIQFNCFLSIHRCSAHFHSRFRRREEETLH